VIFETVSSLYVLLTTEYGEVFLLSIVHISSAVHLVAETLVSESSMKVIYINGFRAIENSTLI
jgi:hypothetical protein